MNWSIWSLIVYRDVMHSLVKSLDCVLNTSSFELDTTMHAPVLLMIWTADEWCECGVAEMTSPHSYRFVLKTAYVSNISPPSHPKLAVSSRQRRNCNRYISDCEKWILSPKDGVCGVRRVNGASKIPRSAGLSIVESWINFVKLPPRCAVRQCVVLSHCSLHAVLFRYSSYS